MNAFDSLRSSSSLLRVGLGLGLGLALGASCNLNPVSVFTCLEDQNCIDEAGMGAICEPNNLCTVPDAACPSGKRWHERASDLAGKCYEDSDVFGTGTMSPTAGSGSGSGSGTGGESTTGEPPGTTTNPVDGSDSSSSSPPMTDEGSSTNGMPMTCQEQFGMAMGYELCEETMDSCSFNAVTGGGSCDDICMMYGSTCITAFNNDMGDCASQMMEAPCAETANDQICVCAK